MIMAQSVTDLRSLIDLIGDINLSRGVNHCDWVIYPVWNQVSIYYGTAKLPGHSHDLSTFWDIPVQWFWNCIRRVSKMGIWTRQELLSLNRHPRPSIENTQMPFKNFHGLGRSFAQFVSSQVLIETCQHVIGVWLPDREHLDVDVRLLGIEISLV